MAGTSVVFKVDGVGGGTPIEADESILLGIDAVLCVLVWLDDTFDQMTGTFDAFGREGVGGGTSIKVFEAILLSLFELAKVSAKILFWLSNISLLDFSDVIVSKQSLCKSFIEVFGLTISVIEETPSLAKTDLFS